MKIYNNRVEVGKIHKNWINSCQHNEIPHTSDASVSMFLWFIGIFVIGGVVICLL